MGDIRVSPKVIAIPHKAGLEKDSKTVNQQEQYKCAEFKGWGDIIPDVTAQDLEQIFNELTQLQKECLTHLKLIYFTNSFSTITDLNSRFEAALDIIDLNSEAEGEKLTEQNQSKGMFFFKYLSSLIRKQIRVGSEEARLLKDVLNQTNKDRLLSACRKIVHDCLRFPSTMRDFSFFNNPCLKSLLGQALSMHRIFLPGLGNEGLEDVYDLKDFILRHALSKLYPKPKGFIDDKQAAEAILLSGPIGSGKDSFARAVSQELALPTYVLNKDSIYRDGFNLSIGLPDGTKVTLYDYKDILVNSSPCTLLIENVENILTPRQSDEGRIRKPTAEEEYLTNAITRDLLMEIGAHRDRILLIMTTSSPPTSDIDLSLLNEHGYSMQANNELDKYVSSSAIRCERVSHKIFSFHKRIKTN